MTVLFTDGTKTQGDVLVGAERHGHPVGGPQGSAFPQPRSSTPASRASVFLGRTPLTPELAAAAAAPSFRRGDHRRGPQGRTAADRGVPAAATPSGRVGRDRPGRDAGAGRGLCHDQRQRRARDGHPAAAPLGTADTPTVLRKAMLRAIGGWHPAARALVAAGLDLYSLFVIPFGFPKPVPPWEPSRG